MVFLTGDEKEAFASIKRAMRLNPYHSDWYEQGLGVAAYAAGRYSDAITALLEVTFHVVDSRVAFAASYAKLGQTEQARQQAQEIIKLEPDFTSERWIERMAFADEADASHFREGLRQAGLPGLSE